MSTDDKILNNYFAENLDYYFVSFKTDTRFANTILPQKRPEDGSENPDGFNIAAAYGFLEKMMGETCLILNYQRTTKRRALQFRECAGMLFPNGKQRHLKLLKHEMPPTHEDT